VGDTISWALQGFHNRLNAPAANFAVVDMPGLGLNVMSGSLPAFSNSGGVTYSIRYRVAGSNAVHTHATGIPANAPFTFSLPQPGDRYYTHIEFYFGTVPVGFAWGNEIVLTFRVGDNAPNNTLINHFVVMHNGAQSSGGSTHDPIVIPPATTPSGGNPSTPPTTTAATVTTATPTTARFVPPPAGGNTPAGNLPQTGIADPALWLASALLLAASGGLGTMCYVKIKKRKRKGAAS